MKIRNLDRRVNADNIESANGIASGAKDYFDLLTSSTERLPVILADLRQIVKSVDPIELVAKLGFMHQWSTTDKLADKDRIAHVQVRLEFLCWVIVSQQELTSPPGDIDGRTVRDVMRLLDEYFVHLQRSRIAERSSNSLAPEDRRLHSTLEAESTLVRGDGLWYQMVEYAQLIYRPHRDYMLRNLGFDIDDAVLIVETTISILTRRWNDRCAHATIERMEAQRAWKKLKRKKSSRLSDTQASFKNYVKKYGIKRAARNVAGFAGFDDCKPLIAFTAADVVAEAGDKLTIDQVASFLAFASESLVTVQPEPDPAGLNPLYVKPFWRMDDTYYLPQSNLLYDFILNSFHFAMIADDSYRTRYDAVRGEQLEVSAIETLLSVLPGASGYHSLSYGPKKARNEVDGIVLYDNRLIVIEAKSKQLTLAARRGDPQVAKADLRDAVLVAYDQAKRVVEYVTSSNEVTFQSKHGDSVVLKSGDVTKAYILCVTGKGSSLSALPVRIMRYYPAGTFDEKLIPAVIPLMDLKVLTEFINSPFQLFDYLERRAATLKDGRFGLHDEWDVIGTYLHGVLDPTDRRFIEYDSVPVLGMDDDLDRYLRFKHHGIGPKVTDKPKRKIPARIATLLKMIEDQSEHGKTDFGVALLRFPDGILRDIDAKMAEIAEGVAKDGIARSTMAYWVDTGCGFTGMAAASEKVVLGEHLEFRCQSFIESHHAKSWLGVGLQIGGTGISLYYWQSPEFVPFTRVSDGSESHRESNVHE